MRLLEKGLHGGLGIGNLGFVIAGHGVGKTPFLVGVALDALLRGGSVMHVCLDQTVSHVRTYYDTVFETLVTSTHLEDAGLTHAEIDKNRSIRAYAPSGFTSSKLRQAVKIDSDAGTRPALLIVDSERTVKFLAGLPGSTWRSVDDVCRSWTRTGKIVAGIRLMLRGTLPIVVVELKYRVRRTLKVLEVLGSHPKGSVRAILNEVLPHPLRGVWLTEKNQAGHLALLGPAPDRAAGPDSARGTGRGIGGAQFLKLSPRRDVLESLQ